MRHTIKAFRYSIKNNYEEVALIEVEGERYEIKRVASNGSCLAFSLKDGKQAPSTIEILKKWIRNIYGDKYDYKIGKDINTQGVGRLFFKLYALQ